MALKATPNSSREPLKNIAILFFLSVNSVVFQQSKSTTEGTEFTERTFSEVLQVKAGSTTVLVN
jgi:hypothetical protein